MTAPATARTPAASPVSPPTALAPRAARLAAELEAWPRRTVSLSELWTLFAAADPASSTRATRRADLAATLQELASTGMVALSSTQDRTAHPALPTRLTLAAPAPTPRAAALARAVPWRPQLAWAASARLTVGQVGVLQTVNTWLRDRGRDDDIAPLHERSLELLGHEKRLDALLTTSLFGPDRLTLSLLRTFRANPPLSARQVGTGGVLIVVENADTFDTLVRLLTSAPGDVGWVGWGAGGAFETSVRSIGELAGVTDIVYFGDIDDDGLRIPAAAAAAAAEEGLPQVRPARGLYRLLLDTGVGQPGQPPLDHVAAHARADWIAGPDAARAAALLEAGLRIPQETVTARLLTAHVHAWRDDLTQELLGTRS